MDKIVNVIFNLIANFLCKIASVTGLTYYQINIVVYYIIIPLTWFLLLDIYFQFYYLTLGFVIFLIGFFTGCRDFKSYSDWLFNKSYIFLNLFNRLGSNYHKSSVWICVFVPILIYLILFWKIINMEDN